MKGMATFAFAAILMMPYVVLADIGNQNAIGNLCSSRPWATGIMATLLPTGFLDGVCAKWGYGPQGFSSADTTTFNPQAVEKGINCPRYVKPGTEAVISWSCGTSARLSAVAGLPGVHPSDTRTTVAPDKPSQTYGIRCSDGFENFCTIRTIDPKVNIWAEPTAVRLGARANIFWASQDTTGCSVTGPSFNETGLEGGASTVSITRPTTYTALCTTAAGDNVEASVTVDFSR